VLAPAKAGDEAWFEDAIKKTLILKKNPHQEKPSS
jgi:hypothetical protein